MKESTDHEKEILSAIIEALKTGEVQTVEHEFMGRKVNTILTPKTNGEMTQTIEFI